MSQILNLKQKSNFLFLMIGAMDNFNCHWRSQDSEMVTQIVIAESILCKNEEKYLKTINL